MGQTVVQSVPKSIVGAASVQQSVLVHCVENKVVKLNVQHLNVLYHVGVVGSIQQNCLSVCSWANRNSEHTVWLTQLTCAKTCFKQKGKTIQCNQQQVQVSSKNLKILYLSAVPSADCSTDQCLKIFNKWSLILVVYISAFTYLCALLSCGQTPI